MTGRWRSGHGRLAGRTKEPKEAFQARVIEAMGSTLFEIAEMAQAISQ